MKNSTRFPEKDAINTIALWVVVTILVLIAPGWALAQSEEQDFQEIQEARSRISFRRLLRAVVRSDFEQAKKPYYSTSDSVALNAYWFRLREELRDDRRESGLEGGLPASRFIGFLEGRFSIDVPPWYSNCLISSRISSRSSIHMPNTDSTKPVVGDFADFPRCRMYGEFELRKTQNQLILVLDEEQYVLRGNAIESVERFVEFDGEASGGIVFAPLGNGDFFGERLKILPGFGTDHW